MSDVIEHADGRVNPPLKKETHRIPRGDGFVLVEITFTPKTGKPVRMHRLLMKVVQAEGCSPYVFTYQRAAVGAPMEDGSPRDEFIGIADELDEDEIPVGKPDLARNVPYYRTDDMELVFRNHDQMFETAHALIAELGIR